MPSTGLAGNIPALLTFNGFDGNKQGALGVSFDLTRPSGMVVLSVEQGSPASQRLVEVGSIERTFFPPFSHCLADHTSPYYSFGNNNHDRKGIP